MTGSEILSIATNYVTLYKIAYCVGILGTLVFDKLPASPEEARERLAAQGITERQLMLIGESLVLALQTANSLSEENGTDAPV